MKYILITLVALFLLVGCHGLDSTRGGNGTITSDITTTTVEPDGTTSTKHEVIKTTVVQPDNSATEATATSSTDAFGTTTTQINTGKPNNTVATNRQYDLLNVPMYCGCGIVLVGLLVVIFAPPTHKIWGLFLCLSGGAMTGSVFLLAKYSIYFLGLAIILIAYGIYALKDFLKHVRANEDNVALIQIGKETGAIDSEKLAGLAQNVQSPSSKKIVKKIKEKKLGKPKT